MAKKELSFDKEKIFFGSLILAIISIFLPWIKVPLLGSYSAINNWQGIVGLLILAVLVLEQYSQIICSIWITILKKAGITHVLSPMARLQWIRPAWSSITDRPFLKV